MSVVYPLDPVFIQLALAEYIAAGNDAMILESFESGSPLQEALAMAVLEDKTELLALLNNALAALQADGTIDALVIA